MSNPPQYNPDFKGKTNTQEEFEYGEIDSSSVNKGSSASKATPSDKLIGAAAIAGGVAGLVIAGPVIGVIGAAGAAALATQDNKAGEVARASGDVVIAAGEKAKQIDEKHDVVNKTKKAAGGFVQKTKEFEQKHHLGEKAGKSMTKGLEFVAKKLKPKDQK